MAVEQGMVPRNVCDSVKKPRVTTKRREVWSPEQTRQFLEAAQHSGYGPVWLTAATGLRRSELLGLRWSDVDLDRRTICIRQSVTAIGGAVRVSARTKNDGSARILPIPPRLVSALQSHRVRQNERRLKMGVGWQDHDLVFASQVGTPIGPRDLVREYHRWLEVAGVPPLRIHDMRHAFATVSIATGVPVPVVSELLGHSRASTTLDIYAHTVRGQHERAVAAVDAILFPEDE